MLHCREEAVTPNFMHPNTVSHRGKLCNRCFTCCCGNIGQASFSCGERKFHFARRSLGYLPRRFTAANKNSSSSAWQGSSQAPP